ncbi:twin-arginine translocase subunit TatC [Cysteiniphilum sp. JM-1]|uniref:twin-arginine translocase subunit TatC n=1 Tax=Cysteiniphilum sp. JM-1 TaxID=2610891 RepID=UPI001243FAD7|nr:twin-arginine translocase subunit TatC [Cysteiniphilum sp. JM-1]
MKTQIPKKNDGKYSINEYPILSHIHELKKRLIRSAALFALVFISLYPSYDQIYNYVVIPAQKYLPTGSSIISTDVTSPFFTPLRLIFHIDLLIVTPYILMEIWLFLSPALYRREKRFLFPIGFFSTILFYTGFLVSYFVLLPVLFRFFVSVAPSSVQIMTDMTKLTDFIISTSYVLGIVMQIPIIMLLLTHFDLIEQQTYKAGRRFAIVGAFIIGMLIAPDVTFQFIFALPIYLLYEVGILISGVSKKTSLL